MLQLQGLIFSGNLLVRDFGVNVKALDLFRHVKWYEPNFYKFKVDYLIWFKI